MGITDGSLAKMLQPVIAKNMLRNELLENMENGEIKEWIIELQETNERLYSDIRGLNSALGRTLWNPQG